jgi:TorA-specific chaperone
MALCDWLAAIFAAPVPADRLAAWRGPEGAGSLAALGEAAGLAAEVAGLQASLGTGDPAAEAAAIEAAHVALFSGAGGPATVAPYESVHRSARGLMFQEPMAAMQALLQRLDLAATGLPQEPPDHIAVQLALLAELLRRGDDDAAAGLLEQHLLRWAPGFAELCRRRDPHGLFAAAGALLAALLLRLRDAVAAGPSTRPDQEAVP